MMVSCSTQPGLIDKDERMYLLDLMLPDSMDAESLNALDPRLKGSMSSPDPLDSLVAPHDVLGDTEYPFIPMAQSWDPPHLQLGEPMLSPSCTTSYHGSSTPLSQTFSSIGGDTGFAYSQTSPDIHEHVGFLSPAPSFTMSSQAAILPSPPSTELIDPDGTGPRQPSQFISSIFDFGRNGSDETDYMGERQRQGSSSSLDFACVGLAPAPPLGSVRAEGQSHYPRDKAETKKLSTNERAKNHGPDRPRRRKRSQSVRQVLLKPPTLRKKAPKIRHGSATSRLTCGLCGVAHQDLDSLEDHIRVEHNRPFTCIFHHAGCQASFTTKNEWKRHVNVQHLQATYYLCTHGPCATFYHHHADKHAARRTTHIPWVTSTPGPGKMFTRKDLFDSHIRRLHCHDGEGVSGPQWVERIRGLRSTAFRTRFTTPLHMVCPARSCRHVFVGVRAWEDRLEHISEHMENAVAGLEAPVRFGPDTDGALWQWASGRDIGIVGRTPSGWALCQRVPSLMDTPLVADIGSNHA